MSTLVIPLELITNEIFNYLSFLEIGIFSTALGLKVNYKNILVSRIPMIKNYFENDRFYKVDDQYNFKNTYNQLRSFINHGGYLNDLFVARINLSISDLQKCLNDTKLLYKELTLILNTLQILFDTAADLDPYQDPKELLEIFHKIEDFIPLY
ncbi:MAG TPA: hypothetical protein VKR58_15155 [Aquella sp.]|nr:hypothetical protein [Aquella sp.]